MEEPWTSRITPEGFRAEHPIRAPSDKAAGPRPNRRTKGGKSKRRKYRKNLEKGKELNRRIIISRNGFDSLIFRVYNR